MEAMLMNPATGSVAPVTEWHEDFESMTPEEWGGDSFEDAGLIEVVMNNNGDWVEVTEYFPSYAAHAEIIREDQDADWIDGYSTLTNGVVIRYRGDGTGTDEEGNDWTQCSVGVGTADGDGNYDEYEFLGWTLTR